MASKVFEGSVSIILNTKGQIKLKKDPEGKFSAANAAECYKRMMALGKERKAEVSVFKPEGGTEPVILTDRYGNPYMGVLVARKEGAKRAGVVKLA